MTITKTWDGRWAIRCRLSHRWKLTRNLETLPPYLASTIDTGHSARPVQTALFETRAEAREAAQRLRRRRTYYRVTAVAVRVTVEVREV